MRNGVIKFLLVAFVAAASLGMVADADAGAGDTMHDMGKKLYRGTLNAASGWAELPKTIVAESKEHDLFTGLVWGSVKGSGMAVTRTGAGGYEAGTFLLPVPKGYKPVMEPEYVF